MSRGIGLIGQKVGMTQFFDKEGRAVGVTVILAGPCVVTKVKSAGGADGYDAAQMAFREEPKASRLGKPRAGVFAKLNMPAHRALAEFRPNPASGTAWPADLSVGSKLAVDLFKQGDRVDVQGTSKGHGFQGVVKRYGFAGGPDTHGSMMHRAPGSIGASTDPGHTLRGTRMAGRHGNATATSQNLVVIKVDPENNLLVVRGAVPGAAGTWLKVTPTMKRKAHSARRLYVETKEMGESKTAAAKKAPAKKS